MMTSMTMTSSHQSEYIISHFSPYRILHSHHTRVCIVMKYRHLNSYCILNLSVCLFVCLFVCLNVRPSIRSLVTKLVNTVFSKRVNWFDANWHKWSTRQGHEMINLGSGRSRLRVTEIGTTVIFGKMPQELSLKF